MTQFGTKRKRFSKKEAAAIAVAVAVCIVALVVVCGVAFGGWLSAGAGDNAAGGSASSSQSAHEENAGTSNQGDAANAANAAGSSSSDGAAAGAAANTTSGADGGATSEGSSNSTSGEKGVIASDTSGAASSSGTSSSSSAGGSSAGGSDAGSSSSSQSATITVSVTIDSSRAHAYNAAYAESMGARTLTLDDGASVYDALCQMGVTISGDSTYVRSINGLAEFACGSNSGWIYQVDGVSPKKSCGRYALHGGENVVWIYTCDYAADGF